MIGLMFVHPEVNVNCQCYRDVLLSRQMLPAIKRVAGNTFIFQHESAPAHRARDTIQLLQRETPDFIGPVNGRHKNCRSKSGQLQDLGSHAELST